MKTIITAFKRWWATYKVRSLEIELEGKQDALSYVEDYETRCAIFNSMLKQKDELAKARSDLNALYAP